MVEWLVYENPEYGSLCALTCGSKLFPPISVRCEKECLHSGSTPRHLIDYREGPGNPKKKLSQDPYRLWCM